MSTIAAILLGLALLLVVVAPLGIAYWKPGARLPVALLYGVLLSGLAVHHTGLSFAGVTPTAAAGTIAALPAADSDELRRRCAEAVVMAERGSIILDRSEPGRVVVDRALWNQVPEFVREGMLRCLEISRPAGQEDVGIEIVEE